MPGSITLCTPQGSIALATFMIEKPNRQVSTVVVPILKQLQNLTPAILAKEGNDNSSMPHVA